MTRGAGMMRGTATRPTGTIRRGITLETLRASFEARDDLLLLDLRLATFPHIESQEPSLIGRSGRPPLNFGSS
jgi:hypothetical protein